MTCKILVKNGARGTCLEFNGIMDAWGVGAVEPFYFAFANLGHVFIRCIEEFRMLMFCSSAMLKYTFKLV